MALVQLEPIDRALLDGAFGAAAARAMAMLLRYGDVLDAECFVPIQSAHIDGCLYHGPSSIHFVQRFVELDGRVRVPTTLNVAAVDVVHPGWYQGDPSVIDAQRELTRLHEELGCLATLTCAPYQRMIQPLPGEHIAWAESNAIVFANSVLGARTDRYGDFTDLCAALTGRVPYVGLHRPENRLATLLVEVPDRAASALPPDLYFACLGYVLGKRSVGHVPVIVNLASASRDELKALGAAAASSGALAMFHVVGVTPEAATLAQAAGGLEQNLECVQISEEDLRHALTRLCPLETGEPIAAVCLGTPHFSIEEFEVLAALCARQAQPARVEVYVSTSREIEAQVRARADMECIFGFGVQIVVDTCTYLAPVVREKQGAIATNSGKWAHYGPGNLKRRVGLMTLDRCIRSASAAHVVPQ